MEVPPTHPSHSTILVLKHMVLGPFMNHQYSNYVYNHSQFQMTKIPHCKKPLCVPFPPWSSPLQSPSVPFSPLQSPSVPFSPLQSPSVPFTPSGIRLQSCSAAVREQHANWKEQDLLRRQKSNCTRSANSIRTIPQLTYWLTLPDGWKTTFLKRAGYCQLGAGW